MTKEVYLSKLESLIDTLDKINKAASPLSTRDAIQMLRLNFDIVTAAYNCTKEEKN